MQNIDFLTWFGYLASVVTATSLLMSKPLKLRWLNLAGSLLFAAYGILIEAYPVGFFNAIIVFIDLYYIIQIYRSISAFKAIQITSDNDILTMFVSNFSGDISQFFPDYTTSLKQSDFLALQLRDMTIIGIVAGKKSANGTLEVDIDYTSPNNRDYKPGRYFYSTAGILPSIGVKQISTHSTSEVHTAYLKKIGFKQEGNAFMLTIDA